MMPAKGFRTVLLMAFVGAIAALLASFGIGDTALAESDDAGGETVVIELRIWQHVEDAEDVWVSARPRGGAWDTLGTIPFPLTNHSAYRYGREFHRFADLAIAGAELRVWQRYSAPELIYVRACASLCPSYEYDPGDLDPEIPEATERWGWTPMGMVPVPLDDGFSSSGHYRHGNVTVAVPIGNPGLLSDREHLLALRDALAGEASLNWSASRPTSDWEGVTVEGVPPRVTTLRLPSRGLTGEVWGWLGDLTELTALRLEGNRLTGAIPSKLSTLTKLTELRLGGNRLQGCIPPPLKAVENNDLAGLTLPGCAEPVLLPSSLSWVTFTSLPHRRIGEGAHRWLGAPRFLEDDRRYYSIVFDVPPGVAIDVFIVAEDPGDAGDSDYCAPCQEGGLAALGTGFVLAPASGDEPQWPPDTWYYFLGLRSGEGRSSRHMEEDAFIAAFAQRIAASVWITRNGAESEWSWE